MRLPFVRRRALPPVEERAALSLSLADWADYFKFGNTGYLVSGFGQTMPGQKQEQIQDSYSGLARQAYRANGVVFACILVRMLLFSEARFQFRRLQNGRPGDLFGTVALEPLERPWPNGTTGDLLSRAEQDSSLAGNFFAVRRGAQVKRLRPDWMTIVAGSPLGAGDADLWDIDTEVVGYLYHPGGRWSDRDPVPLDVTDVAHYAPIPDPGMRFRGMSWLSPILDELMADQAATTHKLQFFENAATPNLSVSFDKEIVSSPDKFQQWVDMFDASHKGVENAYKTLYMIGGSVTPIGMDMKQLEFKATQGAGETRIAAASGVPPVIVGLSEGLQAATYSNYGQARRRFVDMTMRPLWRQMAGALSSIVDVPSGAELWYDDRDIPALREDERDAAEIITTQAQSIRTLTDGGYDPQSVVNAVVAGDLSLLSHTGLTSVQLLPPGTTANGNGNGANGEVPARDVLAELAREEN